MTIELKGNWCKGLAVDIHTLSSTYLGPDENGHERWENVRSDMGELVYQLKYHGDRTRIQEILRHLNRIKGIERMDCLIPIPSTNKTRGFQPVLEITRALGAQNGIEVLEDILRKTPGGNELKGVMDMNERERQLGEHMQISRKNAVCGKSVLLVDDLYRSGATLRAATRLLYEQGGARIVNVLAMTKTRSIR